MKLKRLIIKSLISFLLPYNLFCQDLDLGQDTSYCTNSSITLESNIVDTTYSYMWNTGDTTSSIEINNTGDFWLNISYDSIWMIQVDTGLVTFDSIITLSDTIHINIYTVPIPMFSTIANCFGLPSKIINTSIFEPGSTIKYIIGLDTFYSVEDTVPYTLSQNGGHDTVFSTITQQNGCFALDTFTLSSLKKPTILLQIDSTCENIAPVIQNHSTDTIQPYAVAVSETTTYLFNGMDTFQLPIQTQGTHSFNCILTNANGCSDTMNLPLYIFDILPREIIGLEPDYCVGAPADVINGNFPGGYFTGQYITNLSTGQALFDPNTVDSDIVITYTYTDSNSCALSTSTSVNHVFALPQLTIEGLDDQYCQFDPSSIVSVMPPGGELSGPGLTDISLNGGIFTPIIIGTNNFIYTYTDSNMCSNKIEPSTIVHPLPDVELGPSDTLIGIGETLILQPTFTEPNVNYSWSTGHTGNSLEVTNPGYYVLYGKNSITSCMSSDTIRVELVNKTIDAFYPSSINIYPLPFSSELFIQGKFSSENIKVYDEFGRPVKFNITTIEDNIRLGFESPSYPFLVLQLTNNFSVPIVRICTY